MPRFLIVLCLTNLFCWASLVCYSLYFTDFVGQSVYHGDPTADPGTLLHGRYEAGVRAGAVGMALYSASCSVYSLNIEKLVRKFGQISLVLLSASHSLAASSRPTYTRSCQSVLSLVNVANG